MCVILHVGAKKSVAWKQLEACYKTNSHGWGIMWAKDGKLHHVKNVSSFSDFASIWKDVPRDVERAIHFRIKTHGDINKDNCHPFLPSEDIGLMHNGMIETHLIQKNMSDTYNFTEYELKPVMEAWPNSLEDPAFKDLLESVTGYSKLLLMDRFGKVLKTKENVWVEKNGIYYSNGFSFTSSYSTSDDNWWKKNRHRHNSGYGPGYYSDLEQDVTDQVSDLYAGNKTDAEGQAYIERKEDERNTVVSESVDVEIEEEEPAYALDLEQLLAMSDADKLDWVQDSPRSAVYVLNGLMDTLAQAGIFDIDYKNKVTILDNRSAVSG